MLPQITVKIMNTIKSHPESINIRHAIINIYTKTLQLRDVPSRYGISYCRVQSDIESLKVHQIPIQNKNSPILSSTITNTKNASSNKSSLNSLPVTVINLNEKLSKLHSSRPKLEFCIVISIWFMEHPSHTYFEKNKSFQILCYNIPFDIIEGVEEGK